MGIEVFRKHLREKRTVKISCNSEIQNSDKIASICRAAQVARASAVSITGDKKLYEIAKRNTKLPIFISSAHPSELLKGIKMGADAIEIGNFGSIIDSLTAQNIYDITLEAMSLASRFSTFVCATIPSEIELTQQVNLAKKFEILGVDVIQIENYNPLISSQAIISNSIEVSRQTILPVICSTNYNIKTAEIAFSQGLNGISINANMNTVSEIELSANIISIVNSISHRNSIHREITMVR